MTILQKVEEYIFQLYKDTLSQQFTYHNFNHTIRVVNGLEDLLKKIEVSEKEAMNLRFAAWFHDIGYTQSCTEHEKHGATIAANYLKEQGIAPEDIACIQALILATKLDHVPTNLLECIIKDADFSHLIDDNFMEISNLLRCELTTTCDLQFTPEEWNQQNLDFLLYKHRYYTDYARQKWQPKKQQNIFTLREQIEKDKKKKEKSTKREHFRSIDTLFRTTLRNHTQLSAIADRKANILLSVNAIIISICLSTLIPKLDSPSNAHLIIPTFVLIFFSVATIIFAIMSTRPKVTAGTFSQEEVDNHTVNLLFFGSFHKMPLDEYYKTLRNLIRKEENIYEALTTDLYYLGKVLNRKYTLLRITYTVFTIGILASVLAFVLAFRGIGF
ncbi:Pycsar system effector family protein [Myroides fluvii]|uniref:Pycsar system effector family protein n=1 Tax=Myroides fluvii TaxID=2572594 RepID=UPI00131B3B6F|nr:Pycsar system effector family protein [Myroides fluvii]